MPTMVGTTHLRLGLWELGLQVSGNWVFQGLRLQGLELKGFIMLGPIHLLGTQKAPKQTRAQGDIPACYSTMCYVNLVFGS